MDDDELTRRFRSLDEPGDPDPEFADELFGQLEAQAEGPAGGPRWVPVAVGALIVAALLVVGVVVGSGLLGRPSGSVDGSPSLSSGSPVASSSAGGAAPSGGTLPSGPGRGGPPVADDLVRTTVDSLTVRTDRGTSAERMGSLALGAISYLVSEGAPADGYEWALVSGLGLPPASGCVTPIQTDPYDCPVWFGWVARAGTDGSPWLERVDGDCADPPPDDLQTLTLGHPSLELLACYGNRELTLRAWLPDPPAAASSCEATSEPLWLQCPQLVLGWEPAYPEAIAMAVNPETGVVLPDPGQWIEVTAHFDDLEAINCAPAADASPENLRIILGCRAQLVLTAAQPAPGP